MLRSRDESSMALNTGLMLNASKRRIAPMQTQLFSSDARPTKSAFDIAKMFKTTKLGIEDRHQAQRLGQSARVATIGLEQVDCLLDALRNKRIKRNFLTTAQRHGGRVPRIFPTLKKLNLSPHQSL